MIDHFEIKVLNFKQCLEFYSLVLAPLKIENQVSRTHIAFSSSEKSLVELFHAIGISNGYICNGVPGHPDGNNIEAVIYL